MSVFCLQALTDILLPKKSFLDVVSRLVCENPVHPVCDFSMRKQTQTQLEEAAMAGQARVRPGPGEARPG